MTRRETKTNFFNMATSPRRVFNSAGSKGEAMPGTIV
jgi:hypothetical protein